MRILWRSTWGCEKGWKWLPALAGNALTAIFLIAKYGVVWCGAVPGFAPSPPLGEGWDGGQRRWPCEPCSIKAWPPVLLPLPQGEGGGEGQRLWQKCCFCTDLEMRHKDLWPLQPARSLLRPEARSRPGGRGTFLCLAKEKSPKERRPGWLRPFASLRATCGARVQRGLAQTRALQALKQSQALFRWPLRSSAQPDGWVENPDSRTAGQPDSRTAGQPQAQNLISRPPLRHAPAASHPRS